jgi:hypothetical protein
VSNNLSDTETAKLVLAVMRGDLTFEDACASTCVAADLLRNWIDDAIASVGSRRAVYEKLGKIKTVAKMFVLPGGALACIRLHDREAPFGDKSGYWSSAIQLADLADGEVILNYSRLGCRIEEIDIAFPRLCLPPQFAGSETETSRFSVEMELNFRDKETAEIQFDSSPGLTLFYFDCDSEGTRTKQIIYVAPPAVGTAVIAFREEKLCCIELIGFDCALEKLAL